MYRAADKSEASCRVCGDARVRPAHLSSLRAAWWVLVMGLLWRRLVCRKTEQRLWDPRMALRFRAPSY